jgi:hypothetical protein
VEAAALAVDRVGGPVEALAAVGPEWGVEVPEAQDRGWEAAAQADLDHRPEAGARAHPGQEWEAAVQANLAPAQELEAVARGVRVPARDQAKQGRNRVANQGVAQPVNKMVLRSRHPRGWPAPQLGSYDPSGVEIKVTKHGAPVGGVRARQSTAHAHA